MAERFEVRTTLRLDDGREVLFEGVNTRCRSCGRLVQAGYADGDPMITHEQPYCREFERRDVLDFLEWNRGGDN